MPEATVGEVLRARVAERGEHAWLVCDDDRLSYAAAERRSAALARGLLAIGVGRGTHVGVLHPNGSAFAVAMLAAARIGAVVVPVPTFATARELGEQLAAADVSVLLSAAAYRSHDYRSKLAGVLGSPVGHGPMLNAALPALRWAFLEDDELDHRGRSVPDGFLRSAEGDVDGSDVLAIVYTSGSTSAPKGVVHTHAALLTHQANLNAIHGLTESDRLFCNSPFFWIGGLGFALLATLVAGATLVCSNATDPDATLELLEAERPTVTNGFAAGITHLAKAPSFARRDLSSMRRGNLYPIMPADVRPADPELRHNMLGMTEAGSTVLLSVDETDQPEARRGSYGRPAPGFETRLTDGELCLRGPYLMQRYYGHSRERCFDADGWFHTGDEVVVDDEGFFHFLGRRGAMIKTAGANVSPVEVAQAISRVTGGAVAHVFGLPDDERGQIVAAVVVSDAPHVDTETLRAELAGELSSYKVPRRMAVLSADSVPVLSSGKVDLRRLAAVFDD